MAGKFCFLTQFIKSHSLLLVNAISWILLPKNICFVIFLYLIQSVLFLYVQYVTRSILHSLFYHILEYLVILTYLECLYHNSSIIEANSQVITSSFSQLRILVISIQLILFLNLLINYFSSSLFLTIVSFFSWINSFLMTIWTDKGA